MVYKIYTLGCKVNEYESQVIEQALNKAGYIKGDNPDICIINTCTVTNTAGSKSRKIIRSVKKNNKNAIIVAVGCLIQTSSIEDLPIDIALGNKDKSKIVDYIKEYQNKQIVKVYDINDMDFENMKVEDFNRTRAYIKIQDGCDNYCTYCIIPYARGHVRCKSKDDVIKEAKSLAKKHKEIVLTGIHTGNYHDGDYDFADLLNDLVKIDDLKRIRISSIEITELNDKVLEILKNDKIANHMHIPLQAGSDYVLKKMNRKYDLKYFKEKINKIRSIKKDISITTDVIVGFPGEEDLMFEESLSFIKEISFTKVHVFPYSKKEGTAASRMKDQVDGNVKKQRVKKLLELSKKLELNYMNDHLNISTFFLPEVYDDGYLIGHTSNYLLIKAKGDKKYLKDIVGVKLVDIDYPYIIGQLTSNGDK